MSEFEDRVAINDVLARYTDGVNRRDPGLWSSSWDEQGKWSLSEGDVIVGRQAIVDKWMRVMEDFPYVTMFAMQGSVQISGDSAEGVSYTNEIARTRKGKEYHITGEYADRYVKQGGRWAFASRKFTQRRSRPI